MEDWDAPTIAAHATNEQVHRYFVTIRGKDFDGDPVQFNFWEGPDDVPVTVVSAIDREEELRDYVGGCLLEDGIDDIVAVMGLTENTVTIRFSQIAAAVLNMVHGNDIHHAVVEIHRGQFDPSTMLLVSAPLPVFLGRLDTGQKNIAPAGSEGSIELTCASNTSGLTRVNLAKKSPAQQQRRSNDQFRRYSDVASPMDVNWGGEKPRTHT